MLVLGLNGWPGRGHDAAAFLVNDGRVVAGAEEERVVRRKHAYGEPPANAAAFCLRRAGVTLDDVDVVAFGWDVPLLYRDRGLRWPHDNASALDSLLPRALVPRSRDPELCFVPHHLAHAASAYYLSGDERASILVVDGQGERESATLALGSNGKIEMLHDLPVSWSLGYFYDAVGRYIGLGPDQAGKTMGLAAYGAVGDESFGTFTFGAGSGYEVAHADPDLRSTANIDDSGESIAAWLAHLEEVLDVPPNGGGDAYPYADVAATAQAALERSVADMLRVLVDETGERTLHLAGGVGFNASLNGKLLHDARVDRLFVQPLAGDAGVALGAAVQVAAESGDAIQPMTTSLAWGVEASAAEAREALTGAGLAFTEPDDIAGATADLLAGGKIVGWFQGRGEVGPRALGHRSILANPAQAATRDRINLEIKRREWWRPLAPSLIATAAGTYLEHDGPLPYMVVTVDLEEGTRDRLAAVSHVDGSTRPQTVDPGDEPLYHRMLTGVGERTGLPVALNTSFNGKEEPIVWTPADAVASYLRLGLDALAVGPYLAVRG